MAEREPDKETLMFISAIEDSLNFACVLAVSELREHGCKDPIYTTAAGLYAVMCGSMVKFYMRDGLTEEQAKAKMQKLMRPLGDEVDRIFSEHPEHTDPSFFGPPVSTN
jgi:hypothetical protein